MVASFFGEGEITPRVIKGPLERPPLATFSSVLRRSTLPMCHPMPYRVYVPTVLPLDCCRKRGRDTWQPATEMPHFLLVAGEGGVNFSRTTTTITTMVKPSSILNAAPAALQRRLKGKPKDAMADKRSKGGVGVSVPNIPQSLKICDAARGGGAAPSPAKPPVLFLLFHSTNWQGTAPLFFFFFFLSLCHPPFMVLVSTSSPGQAVTHRATAALLPQGACGPYWFPLPRPMSRRSWHVRGTAMLICS